MIVLKTKGLGVSYGHVEAARNVDLTLVGGEVTVILGANGAGKSSIIRAIMGIVRPVRGTVEFPPGREIQRLRADQINALGIAWVPEGRQVFAPLNVMENLLIGSFRRAARAGSEARLENVFAMFPILKERRSVLAGSLSGGEQQMLAFGRALMSDPQVLLLDEPSLGLAPKVVRQVFDTVREFRARGITVLMAEQNARQALKVADAAYVLEIGEIRNSGSADTLANDDQVRRLYLGG